MPAVMDLHHLLNLFVTFNEDGFPTWISVFFNL